MITLIFGKEKQAKYFVKLINDGTRLCHPLNSFAISSFAHLLIRKIKSQLQI